jgi:hypothetical protein
LAKSQIGCPRWRRIADSKIDIPSLHGSENFGDPLIDNLLKRDTKAVRQLFTKINAEATRFTSCGGREPSTGDFQDKRRRAIYRLAQAIAARFARQLGQISRLQWLLPSLWRD